MLENVSAAGVSVAAGHNGAHMMLMVIPVVIVIAAVAGVVYFVHKRRNRSAPMTTEIGRASCRERVSTIV